MCPITYETVISHKVHLSWEETKTPFQNFQTLKMRLLVWLISLVFISFIFISATVLLNLQHSNASEMVSLL